MKNGKAIYKPKGAAGEYAKWACNFYTGCSNDCEYCYCKRGVMAHTWSDTPKLKACFKDEYHAIEVFLKELKENIIELYKYGLFFTFTSDPFLPKTILLNSQAVEYAITFEVPVTVLTKCTGTIKSFLEYHKDKHKQYISFGFTLTGHDELEPNASTNAERIEAMRKLHDAGFKTWASVEPIISIKDSAEMVLKTMDFCDLYRVGLLSGKKYDDIELRWFIHNCGKVKSKFYFKDSYLKQADIPREYLPANCVDRNFNLFNNN